MVVQDTDTRPIPCEGQVLSRHQLTVVSTGAWFASAELAPFITRGTKELTTAVTWRCAKRIKDGVYSGDVVLSPCSPRPQLGRTSA